MHGHTLHSVFHISTDKASENQLEVRDIAKAKLEEEMRHRKVQIIDEISMVSLDMLSVIDRRCRDGKSNHNVPFGGMHVILAGDMYQLGPIKGTKLFDQGDLSKKPVHVQTSVERD